MEEKKTGEEEDHDKTNVYIEEEQEEQYSDEVRIWKYNFLVKLIWIGFIVWVWVLIRPRQSCPPCPHQTQMSSQIRALVQNYISQNNVMVNI